MPYITRPNRDLSAPRTRRQKACCACVAAKTRCDTARPCARCSARRAECVYPGDERPVAMTSMGSSQSTSPSQISPVTAASTTSQTSPSGPSGPSEPPVQDDSPVGTISLRWLAALSPSRAPARRKHLSGTTLYFCSRYLRAFPLQLAAGVPPFVHPSCLARLARARTLVSMFENHAPGSLGLVGDTVAAELANIVANHAVEPEDALASLQAYLLLSLLAYFHLSSPTISLETFLSLQTLADRAARLIPLTLTVPQPSHESYILSESLRRTIFAACVFDDAWNAAAGLPVFVAEELGNLPAPGPRRLWISQTAEWERVWGEYSQTWASSRLCAGKGEPGMRLEELWGRGGGAMREARVDAWVMDADEFGGWVFAICEMGGSGRGAEGVVRG